MENLEILIFNLTTQFDKIIFHVIFSEASDQGCTPCYEVITTKKIVDYDSKEGITSWTINYFWTSKQQQHD